MRYSLIILLLLCATCWVKAQKPGVVNAGAGKHYMVLDKEDLNNRLGDTTLYTWTEFGIDSIHYYRKYILVREKDFCKGYKLYYLVAKNKAPAVLIPLKTPVAQTPVTPAKPSFIKVHGNILYDVNYRSNIDTPYAERDVYQHTIQTYLDVLVKDGYPFRVYVTTHLSNSSFLRNYTDVSTQFNTNDFNNRVKRQAIDLAMKQFISNDSLMKLKKMLDAKLKEYQLWRGGMDNPSQLQKLVEAREAALYKNTPPSITDSLTGYTTGNLPSLGNPGSINLAGLAKLIPSKDSLSFGKDSSKAGNDSSQNKLSAAEAAYAAKVKKLDSLRTQIMVLQQLYNQAQASQGISSAQLQKNIQNAKSGTALKDTLAAHHISDTSLPKGYESLLAVKSFGIGRAMVNYSELSAKNISINGMQLEYNPSYYMALAIGTVDYRFRDYIVQGPQKAQYLGLVRYGFGMKDGNNIILTWYGGKRQLYNSTTTVTGSEIPNYSLMGFTIEGKYKINKTTSLVAEVAKSSSPYYSLDSTRPHNMLGTATKFDDHSNEAYSLKLNSLIPRTQTQLSGDYRHLGSNFQSFSLFTSGSAQSAWSLRVDQPFFRKRLTVTGSVKTNDFTNPLISTAYSSNTVFKSIQATLRIKKWPTVSVGYFPSSQLTKLNDTQYQENLFYTFTATATHVYKVKKTSFLTSLIYTQFYNKVTDTSFVYFNTKNLFITQSAFIGNLTTQLNLSAAWNTSYNLYVIDNNEQYKLNSWLSLGGGIKYNYQTVYEVKQWGYSASASIRVKKLGQFQLMVDDGFIPGSNKQLVENKIGRVTYIQVF